MYSGCRDLMPAIASRRTVSVSSKGYWLPYRPSASFGLRIHRYDEPGENRGTTAGEPVSYRVEAAVHCSVAAALILTLAFGPDPTTITRPLILGVVDSDGKLLPVARFDGRRWRNTWTTQIERHEPLPFFSISEIPEEWLGRGVPRTWSVLEAHGRLTIEATGVSRWDRCISPIVLQTTSRGATNERRFKLAFDAPQAVELPTPEAADATIARIRAGLPGFFTTDPSVRLHPLGILRVRARPVWIIEVSSAGAAVIVVVDVSRSAVRQLAIADAGGC